MHRLLTDESKLEYESGRERETESKRAINVGEGRQQKDAKEKKKKKENNDQFSTEQFTNTMRREKNTNEGTSLVLRSSFSFYLMTRISTQ